MDVMRRPDINGPWRVWRRKTVRLAVSLLLVLSLAVSGGVWWYRWAHPAGPVEPMCLLIMAEDVRPIGGEPTRVLEGIPHIHRSSRAVTGRAPFTEGRPGRLFREWS